MTAVSWSHVAWEVANSHFGMTNIVRNNDFLIFPNMQTCTAFVVDTGSDLIGAHLTTVSADEEELTEIFNAITQASTMVLGLYIVGTFAGEGGPNFFSFLNKFRQVSPRIFASQFDISNKGRDVLMARKNGGVSAFVINTAGANSYQTMGALNDYFTKGFQQIQLLPI